MAGKSNLVQRASAVREGLQECWPGFEISLDEILQPTFNSAATFFERFLAELNIHIDYQMSLLLQDDNNSRLFNDILYIFLLTFNANQISWYLKLHSTDKNKILNLTDFLKPDIAKLRMHIMLLTNFVYYAESKSITTLQPVKDRVFADIKKLEDLEKKAESLEDEINMTTFLHSKKVEKLETLKKNELLLEQEVAAGELEVQGNDIKIQKLLSQLKVAEKENDELVKGLEKEIYLQKHLQSLVVNDPETILSEREQLENDVKDLEEDIKNTIVILEEKKEVETIAQKNIEILKKFINEVLVISEIEECYKIIEDYRKKEDDCRQQIVSLKKSQTDIKNKIAEVKQAILQCEEKYQSSILMADARNKCMDDEIIQLKDQIEEKKNQYENLHSICAEIEVKKKYVTDCYEQYKENIEKQYKFYQKQYGSILKAKKDLENKVFQMLEKIGEVIPE